MATDASKKPAAKAGQKSSAKANEEIVQTFQRLRTEQRQLANKLSELEMDLNEHKLVIETLQNVEDDRKCFRMVGGVLVERTVKEVLPALTTNRDQMAKVIEALNQQITAKGQEINDFKEQNNIKIKGQHEMPVASQENADGAKVANQGVLVETKN